MGSQYTAAQIEKMSSEDAREAQTVLVDELAYWESALAGVAPPDQRYYTYTASVEERRRLIALIRDKLLLATVEKMETSTQTLQSSTAELASTVRTLVKATESVRDSVTKVRDSVKDLTTVTSKLLDSSRNLERFTIFILVAALVTLYEAVQSQLPWFVKVTVVGGLFVLAFLAYWYWRLHTPKWQRN